MSPNVKAKIIWESMGIKATRAAGFRPLKLTSLYPAVNSRKTDPG